MLAKSPVASQSWTMGARWFIAGVVCTLACGMLVIPFFGSRDEYKASPPTRQELGRATWTFLHKLAAMYPDDPTAQEKADLLTFFRVFGAFYPCDECAGHFRDMLGRNPPEPASRTDLAMWLCERHNEVNRRLGHREFECTMEHIEARWGGCGCSEGDAPPEEPTAATGGVRGGA
jgi:Erv1 / Alr family